MTLRITFSDVALVTYAVPPQRLKPLMTRRLAVDIFSSPNGECALVSTASFRTRLGHPGSPLSTLTVRAAAHYTYVKRNENRGIYVFRAMVKPAPLAGLFRIFIPAAGGGSWLWDPRRGRQKTEAPGSTGEIGSGLQPHDRMEIILEPAAGGREGLGAPPAVDDLTRFIFQRSSLYFWLRGRWLWRLPVEVKEADAVVAVPGRLRIPLWQELGLLSSAEILTPLAAHTLPHTVITCTAARPVWSL